MSINPVSTNHNMATNRFSEFKTTPQILPSCAQPNSMVVQSKAREKSSVGIFFTTLLGVGTALTLVAKRQGFSIKPKDIINTKLKDLAVFKLYDKTNPTAKEMILKEPEILTIATGSVAGGLLGGAIFDDKKHFKAKARESVSQLLGNVLVPVLCVGGASRVYNKFEPNIMKALPQISGDKKLVKFVNKFIKVLPMSVVTAVSLGIGILAGNKVSNVINEKFFNQKKERKIHGTDFAPHVDDLSMAITLMAGKSAVTSVIARTIPAFLCVPGLEVGHHR